MKTTRHITLAAIVLALVASIMLLASGLSPRAQAGLVALLIAGTIAAYYLGLGQRENSAEANVTPKPHSQKAEAVAQQTDQVTEGQLASPMHTLDSVRTTDTDQIVLAEAKLEPTLTSSSPADAKSSEDNRAHDADKPIDSSASEAIVSTDIATSASADLPTEETALVPTSSQALAPKSTFDFDKLSDRLAVTSDPADELRLLVGDIRTREAEGPDSEHYPTGLERFAARMLTEAGLLERGDEGLPRFGYVRLRTSGMCYLRASTRHMPYASKLCLLRVESALNAILFCYLHATDPSKLTLEDAYLLNQTVYQRIVAQARPIDHHESLDETDDADGEWAVRRGISHAIETLQLPQRLTARFRTNVKDGNVAIEIDLPPADVFPHSAVVDGLGIVETTGDMRQRAFADYALRLALLMAASAFGCSERVRHVWIGGIVDGPKRRTCYLSVDFDRWRFSHVDLAHVDDLDAIYHSFAAVMRHEEDGWLRPVAQGFSLEEERFCPTRRYIPVSLSSQRITGHLAETLGTDHVSGLAIEEADNRAAVAATLMMHLTPATDPASTEHNVRTIIDLAADDPDPTVRLAAERVVGKLIDGSLSEDPLTVGEEFVNGDPLTRAVIRAQELMGDERVNEAATLIAHALELVDRAGTYDDSSSVIFRFFSSYVERTLYNRLWADEIDSRALLLVPNAYYAAHLLRSLCLLSLGQLDAATAHAQRLVELAPLDVRAHLNLVRCLELSGNADEAERQLRRLLDISCEPESIGIAYYRMAFFEWRHGNLLSAQACYRRAMQLSPTTIPMSAMELSMMSMQNPGSIREEMTEDEIKSALTAHDIPIAPTERVSKVFYDCTRAALDAEIFPVARNFVQVLGTISQDDEILGILRSLEAAPDR